MAGEFLHAVSAVFMIFCLMAVGCGLGAMGWIGKAEKRFIARFVVNIAVPMNCIVGVLNHLNREGLMEMRSMFLVPICCILLSLFISMVAAMLLKLPDNRRGVFVSMAFLSNTMFIGLPISTQLFGEISVPYVMLYYAGSTIFTQTVSVILVERSGTGREEERDLLSFGKGILTKPPILGVIAAFLLLTTGIRPPEMAMRFAGYLSDTVSPLALMYCGYVVYELGFRNVKFERGIPAMLIIRLLLAPLICALLCRAFGVDGLARRVFITEAALPVVSQITVMAGEYGADEQYAAAGSVLSTIGIFVTIPILMLIVR